uniref:Putative secreted protein n=1 Tax=Ixodes scapularis TaxID=6945 RepID=A0A4D5RB38_IXOSC
MDFRRGWVLLTTQRLLSFWHYLLTVMLDIATKTGCSVRPWSQCLHRLQTQASRSSQVSTRGRDTQRMHRFQCFWQPATLRRFARIETTCVNFGRRSFRIRDEYHFVLNVTDTETPALLMVTVCQEYIRFDEILTYLCGFAV